MIDIDRLSNVIRKVDGGHTLGAAALAEAIAGERKEFLGSCGECKFFLVGRTKIGQGKCAVLKIYAPLDFFCADFERKEK